MFTTQKMEGPAASGRRLVVVDIENVVGGAVPHADAVLWAKQHVLDAIDGLHPGDLVVVGVSHIGLLPTGCSWTHLRYVVGSGVNGADLALLEVLEEDVACRFTELVLVSGDGIFAATVAALSAAGVEVTVVAHPDKLAKRLRLAASHVTHLIEPCYPGTLGDAA